MTEPRKSRIILGWLVESLWILLQIIGIILYIPLPAFRKGQRGSIVIVSDLLTSPLFYLKIRSALKKQGYSVYVFVNFNPFRSIKRSARQLAQFIEKESLKHCVIMGHGVGGLLPLALPDEGRKRAYYLLGLGTPFHGTTLTQHLGFVAALRDITPRSEFLLLHRMNALLFNEFSPFSAWNDEWIWPNSLTRFGQGRDLILDYPGRLNLVLHSESLHSIIDFLNHSHPTTAAEKAQLSLLKPALQASSSTDTESNLKTAKEPVQVASKKTAKKSKKSVKKSHKS
ncbi:MAG: hypothetical protein H3C43_08210 [Leptonema sp. (in: Bacteria)]|nr:hypothetical protein [Leptonema sp. (in: bacteria)]